MAREISGFLSMRILPAVERKELVSFRVPKIRGRPTIQFGSRTISIRRNLSGRRTDAAHGCRVSLIKVKEVVRPDTTGHINRHLSFLPHTMSEAILAISFSIILTGL